MTPAVYVPNGTPEEFAGAIHRLLDDPAARAAMRKVGAGAVPQHSGLGTPGGGLCPAMGRVAVDPP